MSFCLLSIVSFMLRAVRDIGGGIGEGVEPVFEYYGWSVLFTLHWSSWGRHSGPWSYFFLGHYK